MIPALTIATALAAFTALMALGCAIVAWLEDWHGARAVRKALSVN